MTHPLVLSIGFLLAALLIAPLGVVRDALLAATHRLLQVILVVGLVAAAIFLLQPHYATVIETPAANLAHALSLPSPANIAAPEFWWTVGAYCVALAPAVLVLEFLHRLRRHLNLLESIRGEIQTSCRVLTQGDAIGVPTRRGVQAAADHMHSILRGRSSQLPARPLREAR